LVGPNGSSESLAQEAKKGPSQRYDELTRSQGSIAKSTRGNTIKCEVKQPIAGFHFAARFAFRELIRLIGIAHG
jgi:hypothetical protein